MRTFSFGIALAVAAALAAAPHAAAAAETPTDQLCPRAVPKLVAFNEAASGKDVAKIMSAARGAADAYMTCLSEAKTRTYEEPYMNYDRTRAAQFLVVEGRALAATGDAKSAVYALQDARSLAEEVVSWQPMAQTYRQSSGAEGNSATRSSDRDGSRYRESAKEIFTAASEELTKLNAPARRQPVASPAPSPAP